MPHAARRRVTALLDQVFDNSLLLLVGAAAALVWANTALDSYLRATETIRFVINDVGMVFFFGLATKEVYEATLPGGPLASPRQAVVPIVAALAGMAVPALFYIGGVATLTGHDALQRGWAIPCATDIAFAYLVARIVFPPGHSAIPFLLLLAIADDALGLIVLAAFYPAAPVAPVLVAAWMAPALVLAWWLRRTGVRSFWLYVLGPGLLSWLALYQGGIHPALALVPVVPFMPHVTSRAAGSAPRNHEPRRTMQDFERWWRVPVQFILFAFGLANAGVPIATAGPLTVVVMLSLVVGKPLGIVGATLACGRLGFRRASDLTLSSLAVLGVAAGIGFTVALFFATAAFPPGVALDQAKMGALLSFVAAPLAIGLARLLGVSRRTSQDGGASA